MVRIRGVKCAISTDGHLLRGEGVYITNSKHVEFVRKRMIDFRPENLVCAECAKSLSQIFEIKLKRAQAHKKQQRDTLTISSSSSLDDYDRMVYRTPNNKQLRDIVKQNAPYKLRESSQDMRSDAEKENKQDNNETTSSFSLLLTPLPSTPATHSMAISNDSSIYSTTSLILEEPSAYVEISTEQINMSTTSSLDLAPSTSAAAAAVAADKARETANDKDADTSNKSMEERRQPAEPAKRKQVHFSEETPERITSSPLNSSDTTNYSMEETGQPAEPTKRKQVHFEEETPEHSDSSTTNSTEATVKRKQVQFENETPERSNSPATTSTAPAKRKQVHFADGTPERISSSPWNSPVQATRLTNQQLPVITTVYNYNDDFTPSINALNGTRMPHVQPIPRRRQFQHVVPAVHDIYMQGITGG